jgi:hypothetical protein
MPPIGTIVTGQVGADAVLNPAGAAELCPGAASPASLMTSVSSVPPPQRRPPDISPLLTGLPVLFLTIAAPLYLAALLGLVLNASVALGVAIAAAASMGLLCGALREAKLGPSNLLTLAVGLVLVAWLRPRVMDSIAWDVAAYGLMKYPEMKAGIVGPYFSYGNVYEFLVSYVDRFLPPVGGLTVLHSWSLVFLVIFACNYARATRSRTALGACLLLLFYDPTNTVTSELSYLLAGKNDVLVAALVLQTWAVFLDRRNSRARCICTFDFAVTNAVAACAVGMKTSALIAIGLPLLVYWGEFLVEAVRSLSRLRLASVLSVVTLAWLFFCWQYVLNVLVLGSIVDKTLVRVGMSFSVFGLLGLSPIELARSSPRVFVIVLGLTILIVVGLIQKAGREVLVLRLSALLLMLLCPWVLGGPRQSAIFRYVLPTVFLVGIDAVAVVAGLFWRLARPFARWTMPVPRFRVRLALPAMVWAVPTVLVVLALAPRTLDDYTAYFPTEYREAYLYFADMPGQRIYSYGLAPYFLVGRGNQHHLTYDLNTYDALLVDPGGLVQSFVDCASPNFLVFSDHVIGNGYFRKLLVPGVEAVYESEHLIILRNPTGGSGSRGANCSGRHVMTG